MKPRIYVFIFCLAFISLFFIGGAQKNADAAIPLPQVNPTPQQSELFISLAEQYFQNNWETQVVKVEIVAVYEIPRVPGAYKIILKVATESGREVTIMALYTYIQDKWVITI